MTFGSETVQLLFHELPTDVQVDYLRLEEQLANAGKFMHVDAVMAWDNKLEVIIRIRHKRDDKPT